MFSVALKYLRKDHDAGGHNAQNYDEEIEEMSLRHAEKTPQPSKEPYKLLKDPTTFQKDHATFQRALQPSKEPDEKRGNGQQGLDGTLPDHFQISLFPNLSHQKKSKKIMRKKLIQK